jgi:hypothetical protein
MSKLLFVPFSVLGGMLAGIVGKTTFQALGGAIDDQEVPNPQHRDISVKKLIVALLLEGAIFQAVRGLFDHGARQAFQRLTGSWPGDERPDPA